MATEDHNIIRKLGDQVLKFIISDEVHVNQHQYEYLIRLRKLPKEEQEVLNTAYRNQRPIIPEKEYTTLDNS